MPRDTDHDLVPVRAATCARDIDNWIASVRQLRQETAGAQITPVLPDIDRLMQEWDPEFEQALSHSRLPGPDLQCDLSQYVTLVCALLDIPVHGSVIASLHQLFSLYNEFRSSQHFKHSAIN
jgi:intraflagellar transport protein 46